MRQPAFPTHDAYVPVCLRPGYCILLERHFDATWVHVEVTAPWTSTLKREFAADVQTLRALQPDTDFYVEVAEGNTRLARFLVAFGFVYLKPWPMLSGLNKHIYHLPRLNEQGRSDGIIH